MVTSPSLRSGFANSLEKKKKKRVSHLACVQPPTPLRFFLRAGGGCTQAQVITINPLHLTVSLSQRQTYFIGKIWKLLQIRMEYFSHFSTMTFYGTELWSRGSVNPWQLPRVIKIIFPLTISHNQEKRSGDLKKWSPKGTCWDLSSNSLN